MRIKKFRAHSQTAAMEMVRREMGADAVLLSTRPVRDPEAVLRGERVEITAAVDWDVDDAERFGQGGGARGPAAPSALAAAVAPTEPRRTATTAAAVEPRIDEQILGLKRLVHQLAQNAPAPDELALEAVYRTVYTEMIVNDVEPALALRVIRSVRRRFGRPRTRMQVADAIQSSLRALLPTAPPDEPVRRIALVGPTGVGKTTTAAKIAAQAVLDRRGPVHLVTIDTYRVAAVEQLRVYAATMGAGFEVAHDVAELSRILDACPAEATVVVDTEGRGQRDLGHLQPLFRFLRSRGDLRRHLVVSATTKPIDMKETIERFQAAGPERLIFTKVDETGSYGPIVSESIRSGLPVSYLGTGQRVPEELLAATPDKLVELALSSLG